MLGFEERESLPYTDKEVGKTYVPPGTETFSTPQYWRMIKNQRKLRVANAQSLDVFLERFEVVDGTLSSRSTNFFDFMYQAADCRFRTFIPIRFSRDCRVKKVYMDDKGNVKEICGENAGENSQTDDVVSPLPLLSDVYYIELVYVVFQRVEFESVTFFFPRFCSMSFKNITHFGYCSSANLIV